MFVIRVKSKPQKIKYLYMITLYLEYRIEFENKILSKVKTFLEISQLKNIILEWCIIQVIRYNIV